MNEPTIEFAIPPPGTPTGVGVPVKNSTESAWIPCTNDVADDPDQRHDRHDGRRAGDAQHEAVRGASTGAPSAGTRGEELGGAGHARTVAPTRLSKSCASALMIRVMTKRTRPISIRALTYSGEVASVNSFAMTDAIV